MTTEVEQIIANIERQCRSNEIELATYRLLRTYLMLMNDKPYLSLCAPAARAFVKRRWRNGDI